MSSHSRSATVRPPTPTNAAGAAPHDGAPALPAAPDLREVVLVLLPALVRNAPGLLLAFLAWLPQSAYALLVLAVLLFSHFSALEGGPVNPEAVDTIGAIVRQCEVESPRYETSRCRTVRALATYCRTDRRAACTVDNFYRAVRKLGYVLPPLRLGGT